MGFRLVALQTSTADAEGLNGHRLSARQSELGSAGVNRTVEQNKVGCADTADAAAVRQPKQFFSKGKGALLPRRQDGGGGRADAENHPDPEMFTEPPLWKRPHQREPARREQFQPGEIPATKVPSERAKPPERALSGGADGAWPTR